MDYIQLITPNPNVACTPGWCLLYVQDAYGLRPDQVRLERTATAAWNASTSKHTDRNFPKGCWVPVWFSLRDEPAGHVALMAPDGSVYSSSSPTAHTPTHHASLDALITYYAKANPLTYLGWTKDVEGTPVIKSSSQGGEEMKITADQVYWLYYTVAGVKLDMNDPQITGHVGKDYYQVTEEIKQFFANSGACAYDYKTKLEAEVSAVKAAGVASDADKKLAAIKAILSQS